MLTIEGYNKDVGYGVIYGWDLEEVQISDTGEEYQFTFAKRFGGGVVHATLGRYLQTPNPPNGDTPKYQLFICDAEDSWQTTKWLTIGDIKNKKEFYKKISDVIDIHVDLPF
jgi:hypothetical protein